MRKKILSHLSKKWKVYIALVASGLAGIAASGLIDPLSKSGMILGTALSVLSWLGFVTAKNKIEKNKKHPLEGKDGW